MFIPEGTLKCLCCGIPGYASYCIQVECQILAVSSQINMFISWHEDTLQFKALILKFFKSNTYRLNLIESAIVKYHPELLGIFNVYKLLC